MYVYLAYDTAERMFQNKPHRVDYNVHNNDGEWIDNQYYWAFGKDKTKITLPTGTIKLILGRELTWQDDPVCVIKLEGKPVDMPYEQWKHTIYNKGANDEH